MKALHRKLLADLKVMGIQIATIAILITGGLSVFISSYSAYLTLQTARDHFYEKYRFADVFAEAKKVPNTALTKLAQIPGVESAEGRIIEDGLVDVPGQAEPALARVMSFPQSATYLNQLHIRAGRLPEKRQVLEAVVHESFATAHQLRAGDTLRLTINRKLHQVQVVGVGITPDTVYSLSPIAPLPDDKHFGILWIRQDVLSEISDYKDSFNSLLLTVSPSASIAEVKRQTKDLLQPYGEYQTYDRSRQQSNMFVQDEIRQQRVLALVIPVIFLAVSTFILNVLLTRLIALHRPQIATLKSLGYSNGQLAFHYFQLVTLILCVGILPSIWAGSEIGQWYADEYAKHFRFPVMNFALSPISIFFGILVGLFPGWIGALGALSQVFSMAPAEALRPPSPPAFHEGLLERAGITSRLDLLMRMIVRSLTYHPFRFAFNIFGIAAAVAILINGSFWTDVIDFMLQRQFSEMRHEDLSVRLAQPRGLNVLNELRREPGVMLVEGERSIPARISLGQSQRDIAVIGIDESAKLTALLDKQGHPIQPRVGGVLLSQFFAKEYRLQMGDIVEFQSLETNRRIFKAQVLGFVEDLMGQQAYVVKSDLHRWLGESTVFDTLNLKVDPNLAPALYVKLKRHPLVAGVSVRQLLLESFNSTVAEMILVFTFVLYIFALAIAGAVLYNSARMGFSEKSWELASLRILGFPLWTTFEVLFIDLGLQFLLALFPGILLGYGLAYLSTSLIHNETFAFPLVIDLTTYSSAALVMTITFLFSGLFLFYKVKTMDFTQALKARE